MSRDAMLEEAIAKAKERKEWQLVEWLRSARGATASARYYTECIADLNAENAKLRELVAAMPYCMEARCLECPMCSSFDTSIGGAPECRASWKLRELG